MLINRLIKIIFIIRDNEKGLPFDFITILHIKKKNSKTEQRSKRRRDSMKLLVQVTHRT